MTPDDAFLQAIIESPDDDGLRLVYADYLEEQGQPERAELIRVQIELARFQEDPSWRDEWEAREQELLRAHGEQWLGPLRGLVSQWTFRRGFVEEATVAVQTVLAQHDALRRVAPLTTFWVDLAGFTPPPHILQAVPDYLAGRHHALPLGRHEGALIVAMPGPIRPAAYQRLDWSLRCPARPAPAEHEQLVEAINRLYGAGTVLPETGEVGSPAAVILVEDVSRYLTDPSMPVRKGTVPFVWTDLARAGEPGAGPVEVEAAYQWTFNGFTLGYTLTGTLDRTKLERLRPPLTDRNLRDVRIGYSDDWLKASQPDAPGVDELIGRLRQPSNRLDWHGGAFVPGGELIDFSPPMKQLILRGAAARAALHRLLDDPQIQNEVVLVLGAVGDETTVPLLIDRYPRALDAATPRRCPR
jgi:uncharacterized protein (TIGR02996 family)